MIDSKRTGRVCKLCKIFIGKLKRVLEENNVKKSMNGGDFESCRFNTKHNPENE